MKKVFSILVLLFLVCNLAIAQQQEWVDKKYNFSSVKNVFVDYEVNEKLKRIMKNIFNNISNTAKTYGLKGNYLSGANIAGFTKVTDAMLSQGI